MKVSNYSYRIIDDYLLIVDNSSDKDNFVSVTNNIENILTEISMKEENIINYNIKIITKNILLLNNKNYFILKLQLLI